MWLLDRLLGKKRTISAPREVDQESFTLGALAGDTRKGTKVIEEKINSGFIGSYSRLDEIIVRLDRMERNQETRENRFADILTEKINRFEQLMTVFIEKLTKKEHLTREKVYIYLKGVEKAKISEISKKFNASMPLIAYHLDNLIRDKKAERVEGGTYRIKSEGSLGVFLKSPESDETSIPSNSASTSQTEPVSEKQETEENL